ncbi:MAG: hypothetical protein ACYC90_06925 [Candidatus Nanopelagicales bacterium]
MSAVAPTRRRAGLLAAAFVAVVGAVALPAPANAMGTGNPYEDMQAGVTYTVYQPSYSAGLRMPTTASAGAQCPAGTEDVLLVSYGTRNGRQFTVTEGNPMCSDIGTGPTVMTTTIKGARATVQAYCDPEGPCKKADVRRLGGHLEVVFPAAPGLRPTTVWIETYGGKNLSAQQLVRIARSMRPVQ